VCFLQLYIHVQLRSPPCVPRRIYLEPLCDVLFTKDSLVTAAQDGNVRTWERPPPPELAQDGQLLKSASQGDAMEGED